MGGNHAPHLVRPSSGPEPKEGAPKGSRKKAPLRFVVQKHAALLLHYDFRLEVGGVLEGCALPKGPSLDPGEKRLAVQVEDHLIEYIDFEGVIPDGTYGACTVLIWDRSTWVPEGDSEKACERGALKFELKGERLRARWMLVRMGGKGNEKNWLLVKDRDAAARPCSGDAVVAQNRPGVVTGRDIGAVAAAHERVRP